VSRRVLLADGNAGRSNAIAQVFSDHGFSVRAVDQGAAALEAALAEVPDAVVCQLDLPLIAGSRLAAILRANPRTRDTKLVYLGDGPADAERRDLGGPVLVPPIQPGAVLTCVEAELGDAAERTASGKATAAGQLTQLPLADVLELFHVSRKTGAVEVVRGLGRTRRQVGRVVLQEGDVIDAQVGDARGKKALFRLLTWNQGSFSFRSGRVESPVAITTPTRALLGEGLRQVREWERIAVDLPPLGATVTLGATPESPPGDFHPLTREVLAAVTRYARVEEVVDGCEAPDYQVLRTLQTLIQRGSVEITPEPGALGLARDPEFFDAEHAARLRDWLELERPGALARRDAKVVVLSANAEALRDFVALLARLPGGTLDTHLDRDRIGAEDLRVLGRVCVDAEVGLELVHVPGGDSFAPIWPVAAHGALATIVLLTNPLGLAVAEVRAACERLAADPCARTFHLLLLAKDERPAPEALRENLGLADEASLLLLPLEHAERADALMRELLERVLP